MQQTIFSSFEPVRRFRQLSTTYGKFSPPEILIEPLDCFLIHQMIRSYPDAPQLIDLASHLTSGESTTLLLSHPEIRRIFALHRDHQFIANEIAEALPLDSSRITFVDSLVHLRSELSPFPKISLLALNQIPLEEEEFTLKTVSQMIPDSLILLFPLGLTGSCHVINAAVEFCRSNSSYRFLAFREMSPFWGASRLGIVYNEENAVVSPVLNRMRQLFIGNFDYLTLLEANLSSQIQSRMQVQHQMQGEPERNPASEYENFYLATTFVKLFPSSKLRRWYRQILPENTRRAIRRKLRRKWA